MSKTRAQLFSLLALLASVFGVITVARVKASSQETTKPNIAASDPLLKEIAGHRLWTRVTAKPFAVFNAALAG